MLDGEALWQVAKLIAQCDRCAARSAITDEYLDVLVRAAAAAIKGEATRKIA